MKILFLKIKNIKLGDINERIYKDNNNTINNIRNINNSIFILVLQIYVVNWWVERKRRC